MAELTPNSRITGQFIEAATSPKYNDTAGAAIINIVRKHSLLVAEEGRLRLPYEIVSANELVFLTDPEKPHLKPGEMAVYPYHEEARDMLGIAHEIVKYREGKEFSSCVDSFSGGGHTGLPMVNSGIAMTLVGTDINPRAILLAKVNAELNELDHPTRFRVGSIYNGIAPPSGIFGDTLYIANAPFALRPANVDLDVMRDGGEDGLTLLKVFAEKAVQIAKTGDAICGVLMSRIGVNHQIEAEQYLQGLTRKYGGDLSLVLLAGRKVWRGYNGRKEQDNPMSLDMMYLKADPNDNTAIEAWREATRLHNKQGYDRYGYFGYAIFK